MSLKAFIKQENQMHILWNRKADGKPLYPEDTDLLLERHKKELADRLASALSPENLCCDGELRGAKLHAKARLLNGAKADLVAMGVTHEWW
jgi:hypothetical protein